MRIGVVDLDTSHPEHWIPIERALGHDVVGLWDGGSVHPAGYAAQFASKHGVPRVFATLDEMVDAVDCAIIHGCDWDTHIAKARPFVAAGKAVLIDKPLAGNVADLRQLRRWMQQGARIAGGSSLKFCQETRAWLARPVAERGTPQTVVCGCGVDEFNYGIHAYAMLGGILGGGIRSVRHLGQTQRQHHLQVTWHDGRTGYLFVGPAAKWLPFYATIVTEQTVYQYQADTGALYRALLEAALPYLAGETDTPPVPLDEWLEPELCALAAQQSWQNGDAEVALAGLTEAAPAYDGAAFAAFYRKSKYP